VAKLLVSLDLIAESLFPDSDITVKSIETWDTLNTMTAMVEIEGTDVPDADWLEVVVTKHYRSYSFSEIKEPHNISLYRRSI